MRCSLLPYGKEEYERSKLHGEFDGNKNEITFFKDLPAAELINAIQHEISHAILYSAGVRLPEKMEEEFVLTHTNGFIAFLIDNPHFHKFLNEMIEKIRKSMKSK